MTLPAMPGRNLRPYLIGAALGFLLSLPLCWSLWHRAPVREGYATAKRLQSGALVLERDPEAMPPAELKRAARETGGKLERAVRLTVSPKPVLAATDEDSRMAERGGGDLQQCTCKPVSVDLGIVRMGDDTRRVVATSPDGEVLGGVDVPLNLEASIRPKRWAAGITATLSERGRRDYGAFLDRDLGPLRLGVEVRRRDAGALVTLKAGVRF